MRLHEILDDFVIDVGLEQRGPDLAQTFPHVRLGQHTADAKPLERGGKPFLQVVKHRSSEPHPSQQVPRNHNYNVDNGGWQRALRPKQRHTLPQVESMCMATKWLRVYLNISAYRFFAIAFAHEAMPSMLPSITFFARALAPEVIENHWNVFTSSRFGHELSA